jgi:hypothetical protein
LIVTAVVVLMSICATQAGAEEYHYGVEINGVLCGYATLNTSPLDEDGRELIQIKHNLFLMLSALGSEFNSEIALTYHVDPSTGRFTYHDSEVDQGDIHMDSKIFVEGDVARCTSSLSKEEHVVELPPDAILENTLFYYHVKRDLGDGGFDKMTYESFEVREEELETVVYTKVGLEKVELAGESYDAIVVDRFNEDTAIRAKMWIDTETGMNLMSELPNNRKIYLTDESVQKKIELANLDDSIASRVNVSIADVPGITYMKVKAVVEPTGLRLTPEDLNVPGQSFTGTVDENIVEGIFEIEHPHYDGAGAPSFPPDFSGDGSLKEYLEPSDLVESDDPVLVEKALSLTEGSADSWEAACRLSRWVSENIGYAIPGGGTARKTYDIRAGECGAHSMLVAAFCRSVGIPARVVWGCMYIPNFGGSFGQHGWNEIYMGDAGWIPVDATAAEPDFVDSGHIRIGVYESMSTALNPGKMEILDYRVGSGSAEDLAAAAEKYEKYVGEYKHPAGGDPFKVLVKDGGLAVDIPNRMVLGFNDPDEDGRWYCKLSTNLFCTFETGDGGEIVSFVLHEMIPMPRQSTPEEIADDVPEDLGVYLGEYRLAQLNAVFTVMYQDDGLAVHNSLEDRTYRLQPPDEKGGWLDELGKNTIYFDRDDDGNVVSMTIDAASTFTR